jgi:hypothetical protein
MVTSMEARKELDDSFCTAACKQEVPWTAFSMVGDTIPIL